MIASEADMAFGLELMGAKDVRNYYRGWSEWSNAEDTPVSIAAEKETKKVSRPLSFTMKSLNGKDVDLSQHQGKVVMIVNVASKCGLTPQYEKLQALHKKYSKDGLAILGFPCNQFLSQEPGTAEEIKEFCRVNYGVSFDMFSKIEVNGDGACELYKPLTVLDTTPVGPGKISWNFEKFIISRNGEVVARFAPKTKPDDNEVLKVIEEELAKK
jgi:glutathione peroxidase